MFKSDDVACLHTCLSAKTYFKFAWDHVGGGLDEIDEASSDEEDNTEEELEVLHQVQSSCHLHWSPQVSSHAVCSAPPPSPSSATHHTSTQVINSSSGSTSTVPTNPHRPGGLFASLSSLPPKIWGSIWVSSQGRYRGQVSSIQLKAKQAYRLAAGENHSGGLHLTGQSIATLADKFKYFLGDATEHGDFTEILHPNWSFIMYVLCRLLRNLHY